MILTAGTFVHQGAVLQQHRGTCTRCGVVVTAILLGSPDPGEKRSWHLAERSGEDFVIHPCRTQSTDAAA